MKYFKASRIGAVRYENRLATIPYKRHPSTPTQRWIVYFHLDLVVRASAELKDALRSIVAT